LRNAYALPKYGNAPSRTTGDISPSWKIKMMMSEMNCIDTPEQSETTMINISVDQPLNR
jgi:hypothetical protein